MSGDGTEALTSNSGLDSFSKVELKKVASTGIPSVVISIYRAEDVS